MLRLWKVCPDKLRVQLLTYAAQQSGKNCRLPSLVEFPMFVLKSFKILPIQVLSASAWAWLFLSLLSPGLIVFIIECYTILSA